MLANLIHPQIVRVLDFGVADHTPYLVMDYAPSGTLRTRHPKGTRLAVPTVVSYVKQCAQALQYAHDQKIIHRDVKPENMLIGRNGEILLSDFGIALVAQSSRYQSTKDMAGTITYMAPEQIEAHPRPASDQYSLGIVTYEWLEREPSLSRLVHRDCSQAQRRATAFPLPTPARPFTGDRAGRVYGPSQETRRSLRVRPCLCYSSGAGQSIQSISTEPATCTHRNCTKFAIATNSSRHPAISTCWATNDRNASKRFVHAGAN